MSEVLASATKAATSDAAKNLAKGVTDAAKDAGKTATDAVEKATKGLGGLLKKK